MRVASRTWFAVILALVMIGIGLGIINSSVDVSTQTIGRIVVGSGAFLGAVYVGVTIRHRRSGR